MMTIITINNINNNSNNNENSGVIIMWRKWKWK